jgi:hypothetical protein
MVWASNGKSQWTCYSDEGHTAVVRKTKTTFTWTVKKGRSRINSGKRAHPVEAMRCAVQVMRSQ